MQRINLSKVATKSRTHSKVLARTGPSRAAEISLRLVMLRSIRLTEDMIRDQAPLLFKGIKGQLSQDVAFNLFFPRVESRDTLVGLALFMHDLRDALARESSNTRGAVTDIYETEERRHRAAFLSTVKARFGVDLDVVMTAQDTRDLVQLAVQKTSSLIFNVNDDLAKRVEFTILDVAQKALGQGVLFAGLQAIMDFSRNRAKLIARDQVSSLNAALNKERQDQVGVKKYVWWTKQDERVRHTHALRHNRVFSWNYPPDDGHPGEPIACRCVAIPYLD